MRFLRDIQNALWTEIPLHRGPVGEPGGDSFVGAFEKIRTQVCLGSFFGSEGYYDLSLEAIWNLVKGTELS
jgi:hypothetical protein